MSWPQYYEPGLIETVARGSEPKCSLPEVTLTSGGIYQYVPYALGLGNLGPELSLKNYKSSRLLYNLASASLLYTLAL